MFIYRLIDSTLDKDTMAEYENRSIWIAGHVQGSKRIDTWARAKNVGRNMRSECQALENDLVDIDSGKWVRRVETGH